MHELLVYLFICLACLAFQILMMVDRAS